MTDDTAPVLVGFDGSNESRRALRWAAELAHLTRRDVRAVYAWDFPANYQHPYSREGWDPAFDARREFDDAVADLDMSRRPRSLGLDVVRGDPARVLIDESAHAALLVMGSRGLGGFAALVIGSVSAKCVRHSACPVLLVRGEQELIPSPGG